MPDQLAPELLDLRERMQRFVDNDLRPLEERLDTGDGDERELGREVTERSRELGFFCMTPAGGVRRHAGGAADAGRRAGDAGGREPARHALRLRPRPRRAAGRHRFAA